jgi:hypothetical protein
MTITLLTDFGTADYFVPAMKGVIHSICPSAQLIDLTHEVPPQDISSGAFTLAAAAECFPAGTIHLAIVDPGVGSARRPLIVEADQHFFVGPDNGLFSLVVAHAKSVRFIHAERAEFFLPQRSATFHGRDVFAPLAGWLARGVSLASLGSLIDDAVRLDWPAPQWDDVRQCWIGQIIHIDHFGNCITNLTAAEFKGETALQVGEHLVTQFGTHYAEAQKRDELFGYLGSAGYWEIGMWCASAAERFQIYREELVSIL